MKKTILLESVLGETRLAVIEDGRLCELYAERPGRDDVTGDLYLGRVENVLPGMNAAFVDIGAEKNGFLYAGDIPAAPAPTGQPDEARIERLVRPGQQLLVQVTKAQSGQKGPRLSCRVNLPGRTMVLMPMEKGTGVSRKIESEAERARLSDAAQALTGDSGMGVILRTAAEGARLDDLKSEFDCLAAQWRDLQARAAYGIAPKRLDADGGLALRCARDMLNADVEAVWADGAALYDALLGYVKALAPEWVDRIRLHEGEMPLFDLHRVDRQLDRALQKFVWLDSGGSLVIEETEAMTVIDVNTGKFTGRRDPGDTIYRLNCEAADEIVRQLRLRDIGGIVVVDFIDMEDAAQNEALLDRLRELSKSDSSRLSVVGMTGLGLVELTRKKRRKPLSRRLMHTCSECSGNGVVPAHETTARRALRELWRRRRTGETNPILTEAAPEVAGWMRTIARGGALNAWVRADVGMRAGEYRLSPVDAEDLPADAKEMK